MKDNKTYTSNSKGLEVSYEMETKQNKIIMSLWQ